MVFRLLVQVACVQELGKMILRLNLAGSRVGNETLGRSGQSAEGRRTECLPRLAVAAEAK